MVQNPIDPPRTQYTPGFPVIRKRIRSNSQPIQPLKLPTISQPPIVDRSSSPKSDVSVPNAASNQPSKALATENNVDGGDSVSLLSVPSPVSVSSMPEEKWQFGDLSKPASRSFQPVPAKPRQIQQPQIQQPGKQTQVKHPPAQQFQPKQTPNIPSGAQTYSGQPSLAQSKASQTKQEQNLRPLLASVEQVSQKTQAAVVEIAAKASIASTQIYQAVVPKVVQSSQRLKPNSKTQRWLLIWFSLLGAFSGVTALAFVWLASPPPSANCQRVSLESAGAQRLYCAQNLVRSGQLSDLVAGIKLVENWSPDQPFYRDAQQAIADWSALVLVIARGRIAHSDLAGAIEAVSQIPKSSPVYSQAQEAVAAWEKEWKTGEAIFAEAQEAIREQNWRIASQQVIELGYLNHDYWRIQQADVLFKQVVREKTARESLTHAQKLAKGHQPDKLVEAITLLNKVAPDTYAAEEAEIVRQEWSQILIGYGLEQWRSGDWEGAFATAQAIPLRSDLPVEGRDLIKMSQATQLANTSLDAPGEKPTIAQVWQLMEAVAATQHISPNSPFYDEAQGAMKAWQAHLQDLKHLWTAATLAQWGDQHSLAFAIAEANQIPTDSPHRLRAQTLIANWQLEQQGLEDQPFLARAERWTRSGKIPDLQAAIAQVQVIPTDRPAWTKAQQLIAQWTAQIQTIEDQPHWDKAQKLAKQGKLPEAITAAAKIQPNRALYAQAQASINEWKAKLQAAEIAEDQPLLDRAYGLAAQQRLTMAIDIASQIAPGRALYPEAQAAIDAWSRERDALWKIWANEPPTSSPSSSEPASDFTASPTDDAETFGESTDSTSQGYEEDRFLEESD